MDKYLHSEQGEMYYRSIGNGQCVVLLHGFCEYSHIWDPILMQLPDELQLLIPDLPGFGRSPAREQITIEEYAADMLAMMDAEGVDNAVVIGHSMGGYIAIAMAAAAPDRLNGLGLVHSHVYADSQATKVTREKAIRVIEEKGAEFYIRQFIPGLFSAKTDRMIVRADIASLEGQSAAGLIAGHTAMLQRKDHSDVLRQLKIPVMIIAGADDLIMPVDIIAGQAALPAICMVKVLLSSGHMGMLEEPMATAEAINSYLQLLVPRQFTFN
ncbi:MAG: hypothetical protein ABR94_03480 [Sphingobacteriales bacterium BACL12 MAG-120802-bin5]|jgi:pimeloyl-ACP methyl ester carboxylesterase|nr:MAG: hypothetical protein ABR94_03480 [Sphingobacteriales bacterium BACL12 MAG-120802-bin5]